jgi:hypothetical protein
MEFIISLIFREVFSGSGEAHIAETTATHRAPAVTTSFT